jgi:plastocyanin
MSKGKQGKQSQGKVAATTVTDESAEQRRARQIKEWEERKKQKERGKSSGLPVFWLACGGGVLALVVVGVVILMQGGSGGSPSATAVVDPRVAGLPIAQEAQIIADDEGQSNNPTFNPTLVTGKAGDVIEFTLVNDGSVAHNLTVSGDDKEFGTLDDFTMDSLDAGEEGTLLVKIDEEGTYPFRCDLHPVQQVGNLVLS